MGILWAVIQAVILFFVGFASFEMPGGPGLGPSRQSRIKKLNDLQEEYGAALSFQIQETFNKAVTNQVRWEQTRDEAHRALAKQYYNQLRSIRSPDGQSTFDMVSDSTVIQHNIQLLDPDF